MFMHKGLKSSDNSCRMKQKVAYNSTILYTLSVSQSVQLKKKKKNIRATYFYWDSNSVKVVYTHASSACTLFVFHTHTWSRTGHHLQYYTDSTVTTCAKLRL